MLLDLRGLSDFTDYFLICHGTSDRQVVAIAEAVEERLSRDLHLEPGHVEGGNRAEWILLDYVDFVVHVFVEEKRSFYALERLWGDAPRVELPPEGAPLPPRVVRGRRPRSSASG